MTQHDSPRAIAERKLEEEERGRRDGRLAELEREERDRRDREHRDAERAAAQEAARLEAKRLAAERGELEDRAQSQVEELRGTLDTLDALDKKHLSALRASGSNDYPPPFSNIVGRWINDQLPALRPRARSLRWSDRMAPDADGREG